MRTFAFNCYALSITAAAILLAGCALQTPVAIPGSAPGSQATSQSVPACAGSRIAQAQCDVLIETGARGAYFGWRASQLEQAYDLPSKSNGEGQSVYVVDAYDNPNAASDLAAYRSAMGLPAGTLKKYNQDGKRISKKHCGRNCPPEGSGGWGVEIDLDIEMASASCPNCTINLVEANTNAWSDLEAAEKAAVKLGATIISNSFDGTGGDVAYFDKKGVTYLASAGDSGYGVADPADFSRVIAVGGTSMSTSSGKRGYAETVWQFSGGGCATTPKPKWQHDPDCSYRTANDVAAVAVGVAEYDSYLQSGWITVDGTSISSPLVAGMVALAGNSTKQDGGEMLWTLSKSQQKRDLYYIDSGSDGSCGGSYLCTAGTMQFGVYSGPSGWGTPHGVGAL